jgi:tetratricopeptide (TPR) repeat protein
MRNVKMAILLLIGAGLTACSWLSLGPKEDFVFPRLESANAQFFYAAKIDQNTLVGRNQADTERKLRYVAAAYQAVIDHFPEDQIFTPLAVAGIGNCYFRMGDYQKTINTFKNAKEKYPNYPYLHAFAEYKIGQSCENLKRDREAKQHYKRCMDTFGHSDNPEIKMIVGMCRDRWIRPSIPERQ